MLAEALPAETCTAPKLRTSWVSRSVLATSLSCEVERVSTADLSLTSMSTIFSTLRDRFTTDSLALSRSLVLFLSAAVMSRIALLVAC